MSRTKPMLHVIALLLGWGFHATPAPAAEGFPRFSAEPCCDLCVQAREPAHYESGYLSSFKMLVPGRDGWLFRSEDDLRMRFGPAPQDVWILRRFREALARRGVELVVVVQPPRGLMHADKLRPDVGPAYNVTVAQTQYTSALNRMRAQGIAVPPLEQLFASRDASDYFFRADHHWTPEGARRTAQVVAEHIRGLPAYQSLPRTRFVTTRDGLLAKRGTLHKAARMLCGHGAADQYVRRYVTSAADTANAEDLFGDTATPQVVLIGTSNSDPAYNFGGFLSEYLQTEVLNVATAGGGMDGAMLAYLPSPEFQNSPPRVLVWEVQTYHNLADARFHRQALPLLDNGCEGRAAALESRQQLHVGRNEVLFNGGGRVRDLKSEDHFIDLKFSDTSIRKLDAVVWFTNGRKEHVRLTREEVLTPNGRFVFGLRTDAEWGEQVFMSMDVVIPPEVESRPSLRTRLCAYEAEPATANRTAKLEGTHR